MTFKGNFIVIFLCQRLKIEWQARNNYTMHLFFKGSYLVLSSIAFAALYLSSKSVSAWTGGEIVKQKAERRRQEEGRGVNMAKMRRHPLWMTPVQRKYKSCGYCSLALH